MFRTLAFGIALAHFLFGDTAAVVLFIVQPGSIDPPLLFLLNEVSDSYLKIIRRKELW